MTKDNDYVRNPDLRILQVIAGLAAHYKKMWTFPNQTTLQRMLRQRYNRCLSLRQLNRHLGALEQHGYLSRVRRHKKNNGGALELHSTMYVIKSLGVRTLSHIGGFLVMASQHHWARRWTTALTKTAERAALQTNIMSPAPIKAAPPG